MKNLLVIPITVFTATGSFAQSQDSTKFLTGKWRVNDGSIEILAKAQLEVIKKSNPAFADQFTIESVKEAIKSSVYEYNGNGTYVFTIMGQQDTGTWKFSDDKRNVLTKSNMGKEVTKTIIN